jgi:hypothetical protein
MPLKTPNANRLRVCFDEYAVLLPQMVQKTCAVLELTCEITNYICDKYHDEDMFIPGEIGELTRDLAIYYSRINRIATKFQNIYGGFKNAQESEMESYANKLADFVHERKDFEKSILAAEKRWVKIEEKALSQFKK